MSNFVMKSMSCRPGTASSKNCKSGVVSNSNRMPGVASDVASNKDCKSDGFSKIAMAMSRGLSYQLRLFKLKALAKDGANRLLVLLRSFVNQFEIQRKQNALRTWQHLQEARTHVKVTKLSDLNSDINLMMLPTGINLSRKL